MPITLLPEHIALIKGLIPLSTSTFKYNPATWGKLREEHKIIVASYEDIFISRKNIIDIYKDYFNSSQKPNLKLVMLVTMLWGFGNTGYGAYRTEKYLTDIHIELFEEALRNLKISNDKIAFQNLMQIKGLGISYVSKILYFASRALDRPDYMLIFDIRVAYALVHMTNPLIARIISVYPSSKWNDYQRYNKMMHQISNQYGFEAEALEMFLFDLKLINNTK